MIIDNVIIITHKRVHVVFITTQNVCNNPLVNHTPY